MQGDVLPAKKASFEAALAHYTRGQAPEATGASCPHNQLRAAVQGTKDGSPALADGSSHGFLTAKLIMHDSLGADGDGDLTAEASIMY